MNKVLSLLILSLVLISCNIKTEENKTFCKPDQRNADFCIAVYEPVCGWFNSSKVQCFKYPCAITSGNSCEACKNENVLYWTEGECPK